MARQARESGIPSRELFEKNPLPMWVYDVETLAFLAVNAAAVRHYGYTRRQFLAMTIKEIRPPEEIPALLEKMSRPVEGHDAAGTWRHRKKDGTLIDVEITTHPIRFAGRKAKLVLANDVTERARLEQSLHAAAETWRQTFDAMSDAVALVDQDGKISRCNKALTLLTKKGYGEIIGRHCEEVVSSISVPAEASPIKEVLTTRRRATATLTSGSRLYSVSADPLFDESGEFVGAIHMMSDVTQQRRVEGILLQSRLRQEAILNNIPDIAWLKDERGRFLAVNEPFALACGFARADLAGKTDLDIWPREFAERYMADDQEVMRSGKRKVFEEPLADKEGKTAWIETIKTPISDNAGRVVGTTGIARDVTERRRAEDALRRKDHVLSEAQRIAHIGSWEADFKTGTITWSDELHRIFGTDPGLFRPSPASFLRIAHRDDRKALVEWTRATTAGEKRDNLEFRVVRPNGDVRWVGGSVEPLFDAAGRPVGAIGTGQDITESKRHADMVQASEKKFRTLFEAADDAIFIVDMQGRYVDVNQVACDRLGYTKEEMLSKHVSEIDTPEFAALVPKRLAQLDKFGKAVFEAAHLRKDGTVIPVEINAVVIDHEGRKVLYSIARDISARKKAEEALVASEQRYRDLFDNASDMIQSVAPDGRFLYVNAAWRKTLGYGEEDLRSLTLLDIVHPSCVESCRDHFTKAMAGEPADFLEAKFVARDGSVVDLEGSASVRRDGGNVVSTQVIFRDVTERKRLREEVYRISHDWEETFDTLTDMVTVHDREFHIVRANKAAGKILGLPFLEAKSAKCFEYFHGTACPPAGCPSCASLVTGEPSVNEIFEPHLGRHLEIRAIPRLDSNHQVVGLIHLVRDISERKRNEEAIERYDRDLAALNAASNALMLITNLDGIYQEICNILFSLFDLKLVWLGALEVSDHAVRPVAHAGSDDGYLREIQVRWDDSSLGMGPTGMAVKTGVTVIVKSGDPPFAPWREAAEKRGYASIMAVPLVQTHGQCVGVLTCYSDDPDHFTPDKERLCRIFANQSAIAVENALLIAGLEDKVFARTFDLEATNVELQRLNKELELRRFEAESASRSKSDFLANMSHELRTPLNAIIGFSDLMVRGMVGPLAEKHREYLGDILAGGKHLLSLINDILDLSKIEAGKMEIDPTEYDLAELIDRSLVLFREKTAKHRLDLRVEIAGGVGPIFGDERKIRQVLYNLLSNAVKFTPDGGSVVVRARAVREAGGDFAEISVSDSGIGISPADQERLFQPFQQLSHHLTKEHEGTGLGLALCRSFVEMHGGSIRVGSALGRGSTFTFRIPLRYGEGAS